MKKSFIKMNDNKKYLSLGNIFNIIKKYSTNKYTGVQSELFCTIFNIPEINNTTVNNYCIGYRAISMDYKKIYYELEEKYQKDKTIFKNIILNIVNILDEYIHDEKDYLNTINNNLKLKKVIEDIIKLAKDDESAINTYNKVLSLYQNNDLYNALIISLFYAILENKQPLNIQKPLNILKNDDLEEYLQINLFEGVSYINSLKELANRNNMYANAELVSLEYSGLISGITDYNKCYNYYLKAAKKNHPKACYMVANLIYKKYVKEDFNLAWEYINKAVSLGSIAAINTLGNFYKSGYTPDKKIDLKKAEELYNKAASFGYAYAYNNLGKLHENKDLNKAINYYKLSADLNESWALNKLGEYYRLNKEYDKAYFYYNKSITSPVLEKYYYGYYNLAKYFYLKGNDKINLKKDITKAREYFQIAKKHGIIITDEELNNTEE